MQAYQLCCLGRTAAIRLRAGIKTRRASQAVLVAKRGLLTQSYARGPSEVSSKVYDRSDLNDIHSKIVS